MKSVRPRIAVSNWVHDDILARLAAIGEVDANRTRTPWPRAELTRRAAAADALLAFMTTTSMPIFSPRARGSR